MSQDGPILFDRHPDSEFFPVAIEGLLSGIANDYDIFMRSGKDYFMVKPRNTPVDWTLINRLKLHNAFLYLRKRDKAQYFAKVQSNLKTIMKDPMVPIREKAAILTDSAVEIIDDIYSDPNNPAAIQSATQFSNHAVELISSNRMAFLHLVELSNHDHYTYAHSVGVTAYAVALAQAAGIVAPEQLAIVGLAGLLHDLGKCMVDPAIINKQGPLSESEWASMKRHPEYGAEIIKRHNKIDPLVALVAESHHEDLLGRGYPRGVLASKLEPLVRIVSLCDAFSALTTKRSYSPPRTSQAALMLMKENIDKKFDPNLFRTFVMLFLDPTKKLAA